jgi:hypothetical protein
VPQQQFTVMDHFSRILSYRIVSRAASNCKKMLIRALGKLFMEFKFKKNIHIENLSILTILVYQRSMNRYSSSKVTTHDVKFHYA